MTLTDLTQRFYEYYANLLMGEKLVALFKKGGIHPKYWEDVSDEDFLILSFDLGISDANLAKIFCTTTYAIKQRRGRLNIKRGKACVEDWYDSDRHEVDWIDVMHAVST